VLPSSEKQRRPNPIQRNPIQSNPLMNPIHVQLWFVLLHLSHTTSKSFVSQALWLPLSHVVLRVQPLLQFNSSTPYLFPDYSSMSVYCTQLVCCMSCLFAVYSCGFLHTDIVYLHMCAFCLHTVNIKYSMSYSLDTQNLVSYSNVVVMIMWVVVE